MIIEITGANVKTTKGMSDAIEEKLSFLDKFLSDSDVVKVNEKKVKEINRVSVVFVYNNKVVKLEEKDKDFYAALDKLCAKLKNQMSKLHSLKVKQKNDHEKALKYMVDDAEDSKESQIVKRKHTNLEVMYEHEAMEKLDLLGYESFVFKNADDGEKVTMIYCRNDGDYGLLVCD